MQWIIDNYWILEVFGIIFSTVLLDFFQRRVLGRLETRLRETTKNPWDDAIVAAVRPPLSLIIWILGLTLALEIPGAVTASPIFEAVPALRQLAIISAFTWFLWRAVRQGEEAYLIAFQDSEHRFDRGTVDAIGRLLRIAVLITSVLVALQTLGFSISGLLAFGGIAVGFAAKDLLSNFFGGLMIYLDRPFTVGDWIYSPDREIEGVVESISWRLTRIRTFDKRPLYVPNAIFSNISVVNPSRMLNRRIYETIGIRYEDAAKMPDIVRDVKAMLQEHPAIDTSLTLMVNFNAFAPSSLDFFIYTFTKTTDWAAFHGVKEDVLLKIVDIIAGHGAEIAFPTSTVHLAPPAPEAAAARGAQGAAPDKTNGE